VPVHEDGCEPAKASFAHEDHAWSALAGAAMAARIDSAISAEAIVFMAFSYLLGSASITRAQSACGGQIAALEGAVTDP
jgi:hypothetical protein